MSSHFFAMLSRMKYINRWGLMNNLKEENIAEHSLDVAVLSHALVTLSNKRLGTDFSSDRAAVLGLFHDASEIITGDLPTPVKYYNEDIKSAYKHIESVAEMRLLSMLPEDIREEYEPLVAEENFDKDLLKFVKAADKLSALIKCIDETSLGNNEFLKAKHATLDSLRQMNMPVLDIFMEEFLPSYSLSLDDMK